MKKDKKFNKINYLHNFLIFVFAVLLLLFLIDGKRFYTISNDNFRDFSVEKIMETIPSTENVEYLAEIHENLSSIFVYKTDDKYAILVFNNSIFLSRSRLSSFIYKIPEIDGFRINESNQIYNNSFTVNSGDTVSFENNSITNNKLIINIINFVIIILIMVFGTIINIKRKINKEDN